MPQPELTVLVTGGAGFIGSSFVRCLLARTSHRIVVLDKLTYAGNLRNLDEVASDPRLRFVRGDIADRRGIDALLAAERPSWVVNFAAESHVDRSIDSPRAFVETNLLGTFELLDAALHFFRGVDDPAKQAFRLLHVSTDEVYGSLGSDGAFSEESPYAPSSPYAATKGGADHLVRAYQLTYGLPTLLTNCSNNFGPRQFPEKLIPLMILNALEGKDLPVYGDGQNVRDWLFVEDHCDGILGVLERGPVGHKFNIGGGGERTNNQIVDAICDLIEEQRPAAGSAALRGRGLKSYRDLRRFVADRPGHDRRYAIDASKMRRELGWSPSIGVEAGLRQTVAWYLENADWCEEIQSGAYRRERLGLGSRKASGE